MNRPLDVKLHYVSTKPIGINASISTAHNVIQTLKFICEPIGIVHLLCDVPTNTDIFIKLHCEDEKIYYSPVTVSLIEFDNFYQLKTFTYFGKNIYDQKFLDYIKSKNLFVEDQNNNNCLFFTGSLVYKIITPISGLIFGRQLTLCSSK
jgi:hypothetical protein